jgi:LEA14-like dessication related protein
MVLATSFCGGCSTVESALRGARPDAKIRSVHLEDVDLDSASLVFDVEVSNPYDAPMPLVKVDHALQSAGRTLVTGSSDLQGVVPGGGSRVVPVRAALAFAPLIETLGDARPGSLVPYTAEVGLGVDAPLLGRLRLPVRREGGLPIPIAPVVRLSGIEWDKLDLATVAGRMMISVTNPAEYPLTLAGMDYRLSLAGREVAGQSISPQSQLGPGKTAELSVPLRLSPREIGLAGLDALRQASADYRLTGSARLNTPAGMVSLPVEAAGEVLVD